MKKILILANSAGGLYNFRLEIIERFLDEGHDVYISSPYGERIAYLIKLGCKYKKAEMSRHGTNPIKEIKLLRYYKKLLKEIRPDMVFSYTIKPNIYGGMACKRLGIPYVVNITGLGIAVENDGIMQKITVMLYKIALRKVQRVFFQNAENMQFFTDKKIALGKHSLLPGSGVNLERFTIREYPNDETIRFAFISRIIKEKGIEQYLEAAKAIKEKYNNTEFHICGLCEDKYEGKLNEYKDKGIVIYHGQISNVSEFLEKISCVVHPTYYPEGISNILLEACASGRPIITTDRSGCREVVEDGINGYIIPCQNGKELIKAIDKFVQISNNERKTMGLKGRQKVENEFDRQIVVDSYINEVNCI